MGLYIGIDLGTSSVKLMLVDGKGNIKNTVTKEYSVSYPHSGWSEQNASDWWSAICDGIPQLLLDFDGNLFLILRATQLHLPIDAQSC